MPDNVVIVALRVHALYSPENEMSKTANIRLAGVRFLQLFKEYTPFFSGYLSSLTEKQYINLLSSLNSCKQHQANLWLLAYESYFGDG